MKLFELLNEGNIKHVSVKNHPNIFDNNKMIGRGFEARVYADKTGGTVIKELPIRTKVEESAAYQYIDKVMSHQDNPFLPRIYSAKLYTLHAPKKKKLVIQMEKLTEFKSDKVAHLLPQLLAQLGIDENDIQNDFNAGKIRRMKNPTTYTKQGADYEEQGQIDAERNEALFFLGDALAYKFKTPEGREKLMQATDNAQLKQAIKISHDILVRGIGHADLHARNLMVRLTSHGPQLVITDPIV